MLQGLAFSLPANVLLRMSVVRCIRGAGALGARGMPTFCGPQIGGFVAGVLLSTGHVFAACCANKLCMTDSRPQGISIGSAIPGCAQVGCAYYMHAPAMALTSVP
jgi:hypothetical protein